MYRVEVSLGPTPAIRATTYTFSKGLSDYYADSSDGLSVFVALRDLGLNKGLSPYDIRRQFKIHPGQMGNFIYLYGPGFTRFDMSAIKKTRIREKWELELRAEFLNAFNHVIPAGASCRSCCGLTFEDPLAKQERGQVGGNDCGGIAPDRWLAPGSAFGEQGKEQRAFRQWRERLGHP